MSLRGVLSVSSKLSQTPPTESRSVQPMMLIVHMTVKAMARIVLALSVARPLE